jgi:serine/threonine protein kinase
MSPELAPNAFPTGTSLQQGKYRLDDILSQSDSLITYRATHRYLDQTVAIQTLRDRPELRPNQPRIVQQFIAAAQKVAKVPHSHIVHVNDLFVESELPFIVTDHLTGESLGKLADRQPLSEEKALDYICQVAPALSTLHQHRCLHGSLQPDYLLLQSPEHRVILTDLGLERALMSGSLNSGSAGYIAPEQYSPSQRLSPAADVYALAAILYTLLTGHRPVSATSRQRTPLSSPRQFCPQISIASEQAIFTGMALRVSERPSTIEQRLSLLKPMPPSDPPTAKLPVTQLQTATQLQVTPAAEATAASLKPIQNQSSKAALSDLERVVASPPVLSSIPPKAMLTRSNPSAHPKFPIRFLLLTSGIAGVMGLGFGFILRFHYFTQFSTPQVANSQPTKIKRESFPPRPKVELSNLSPAGDTVDRPIQEPDRTQDNVTNVEPSAQQERLTEQENRQTLRSSQPSPTDSIVESEIGEIPRELTPTGLTIPPDDSASTNDWADVVPSQSTDQAASSADEETALPADVSPLPDDLDLSDDPDHKFSSPQI